MNVCVKIEQIYLSNGTAEKMRIDRIVNFNSSHYLTTIFKRS